MRLKIANHLYSVLSQDERVVAMVGDNIYPVATKVEKAFPLILYERDTVTSRYDKGGCAYVESDATVLIITEDYTEGVEISEAVIDALDRKEATYDDFDVLDCVQTGAVEGYQDRSFVQQVQFHFITSIK